MKKVVRITENELVSIVKKVLIEVETSDDFLGGAVLMRDLGPSTHPKGKGKRSWPNKNAWDFKAPEGTPVYSLCKGKVTEIVRGSTEAKRGYGVTTYGNQINVVCDDGVTEFFYTHLNEIGLNVGDEIDCGQLLGKMIEAGGVPCHVHAATIDGKDIFDFVSKDGKINCKKNQTNSDLSKQISAPADKTRVVKIYPKL